MMEQKRLDRPCPRCKGSGSIEVGVLRGGVFRGNNIDCPDCKGKGRLDRPELERKIDLEALAGTHRVIPFLKDYCDGEPIDAYLTSASITKILKNILALIEPLIEEAKKQLLQEIEGYKGSYIDKRFWKSIFWQALKEEK